MSNERFLAPYSPLGVDVGPSSPRLADVVRLVGEVQQAQSEGAMLARIKSMESRPLERYAGFTSRVFELANLSGPQTVTASGYGLIVRRTGTAPGARVTLNIGGQIATVAPGSVVRGYFTQFEIVRATGSATAGALSLLVLTRPDADFVEPEQLDAPALATPTDLLGTVTDTAITYATVPENTQPSGNQTGRFNINGWSRVRVLIDGGATALESATLIPWTRIAGTWHENDTSNAVYLALPGSGSGYRYRSFLMSVGGTGEMFLEIRSLLPAALTGLDMAVQGVE